MFPLIKNTLPLLKQSPKISKVIDNIKIINSRRQPPNLKKILTKERFNLNERRQPSQVTKCNETRCGACQHIEETDSITFKPSNTKFNAKVPMNCSSKSVIHCITCSGCRKQGTGETEDLRSRVRVHKQHMQNLLI